MVTTAGVIVGPAAQRRVSVRHGMAIVSDSVVADKALVALYRTVPQVTSARGAPNVQVRVSEGQPYVIDVNPRLPAGGMALSATQGLNLPLLVALDLLGERVPDEVALDSRPRRHYRS